MRGEGVTFAHQCGMFVSFLQAAFLRRRIAADELSTAEVNKHDFVNTALNEDILRPQIPVDKPLFMHMTHSTTHLRQELPRKDWIRSIAENQGRELLRVRDIVHRYTEVGWLTTPVGHGFGALQHVDDAHNVRMRQVRHRERLEASAMLRRVAERNELYSNPVASDPVRRHDYNGMLAYSLVTVTTTAAEKNSCMTECNR